jgi:hypothetical protein
MFAPYHFTNDCSASSSSSSSVSFSSSSFSEGQLQEALRNDRWGLLAQKVRDGCINLSQFTLGNDSGSTGAATRNRLLDDVTEVLLKALPTKASVGCADSGFTPDGWQVRTIMMYWQGYVRPMPKPKFEMLWATDRVAMSMVALRPEVP